MLDLYAFLQIDQIEWKTTYKLFGNKMVRPLIILSLDVLQRTWTELDYRLDVCKLPMMNIWNRIKVRYLIKNCTKFSLEQHYNFVFSCSGYLNVTFLNVVNLFSITLYIALYIR